MSNKAAKRRANAFRQFSEQLGDKRIITTKESLIVPRNASQNGKRAIGKPEGLWYACGNAWIEWCLGEDFGFGDFVHEIQIDLSKVKLISDEDQFDQFVREYGITRRQFFTNTFGYDPAGEVGESLDILDRDGAFHFGAYGTVFYPDYIDWPKVAGRYAGIEINPYLWDRRLNGGMWYYGWDCASGCVWDIAAIQGVKLMPLGLQTSGLE